MRYDITYMCNLKYYKNEHICEINRLTDKRRVGLGVWDKQMHRVDEQGPIV